MTPDAHPSARGPRAVAEATCPRCASADVQRLSLIHQLGLDAANRDDRQEPSLLARYAAPPAQRHATLWTLLAIAATAVALVAYATGRPGTVVVGTVALLATVFGWRAARYNASVYPDLHELWVHSFMCSRCGEIFSV